MEEVKTSDNWVILLGNGRGFRKRDFFFGFWNTPATPLQHFPAAHSLLTHAWTLVGVVGVPPHPPPISLCRRRSDVLIMGTRKSWLIQWRRRVWIEISRTWSSSGVVALAASCVSFFKVSRQTPHNRARLHAAAHTRICTRTHTHLHEHTSHAHKSCGMMN